VLDLSPQRVNLDMVALEPLGPDDQDWLTAILRRHVEETGSAIAGSLLDQGTAAFGRFSKIMPTDYRKILDIQDKARAEGRDPIEAVMEEMSRG
jgi:glutamate synthase (NADPH/NADH) large chain